VADQPRDLPRRSVEARGVRDDPAGCSRSPLLGRSPALSTNAELLAKASERRAARVVDRHAQRQQLWHEDGGASWAPPPCS